MERLLFSWYRRRLREDAKTFLSYLCILVQQHRLKQKENAVTLIQAHYRRYHHRNYLDVLRQARDRRRYLAGRALHEQFLYVNDEEDKVYSYSANNHDFFPTVAELNKWMKARQKVAHKLLKRLHNQAKSHMRQVLLGWKKWAVSLDPSFIDIDPCDDDTTSSSTSTKPPTIDYHPSKGITRLPPLPKLWSHRTSSGKVEVEHAIKYNTIVAGMTGPTLGSAWVAQGLVMMGITPLGLSREYKNSRQAGEAILLCGVGTFVCLMEDHEVEAVEKGHGGGASIKEELRHHHGILRSEIMNQSLDAQRAFEDLDRDLNVLKPDPKNPYRAKSIRDKRLKVS